MRAIYILLYSNLPTQYCTVTVLYITGGNGPGDYNPGVGLQVDRYVSMRGMFPLSIQTLIIVQYLNNLLNQNVIQSEIQKWTRWPYMTSLSCMQDGALAVVSEGETAPSCGRCVP